MDEGTDIVQWGTLEIPYSYGFSRRRTLAISVHPDLSVVVRAPIGVPQLVIRRFVHKRGAWINKALREFGQYLPKLPARRYIGGETHRYLGRQYRLKVSRGKNKSVKCLRGHLWVTTKADPTSKTVKTLLEDWYRQHAMVVFHERLAICHKRLSRENIPLPKIRILMMARRWGSYSSTGRINLNLALIRVPKECIDYVIAHELCHAKVKHHGPIFWRMLGRVMPDFEERRRKLNAYTD